MTKRESDDRLARGNEKKAHISDLERHGSGMDADDSYSSTQDALSQISGNRPLEVKRKRVTRACDNCRQKKVKCDGKQPCIHCTVYSYKCSYDQPNVRNKKKTGIPVPTSDPFLQAAANAAATLQTLSPSWDKNKHSISHSVLASLSATSHSPNNGEENGRVPGESTVIYNLIQCQNILSLLLPKLKLNCLDESKPMELNFEKLQSIVEKNPNIRLLDLNERYFNDRIEAIDMEKQSLLSVTNSLDSPIAREIKIIIPPKSEALDLIYTTWRKACVLFRFYHRPSLLEEVDLLYSLDPSNYGDRQQKFLPFLYSLLACGSLFLKNASFNTEVNETLEDDGYRYFLEARKLIDISNVGDIHSIQTIVMMIMYLQCSARLTTCYSYIGIAIRSALKEGLHRNLTIFHSKRPLDPIEVDTRKRLFYTIYKMDIYINCLLGLPRSIHEDEFDQEFPEDLDDENITRDGYDYVKQGGKISSLSCANHHTRLMLILSHIVKMIYPVKVNKMAGPLETQLTPDHIHSKVTELEIELKGWLDNLPQELKPTDPDDPTTSANVPENYVLANYYLHLAFLNCQIMLYRPFIHFVSNGSGSPNFRNSDPRSLIRGRNCIKVARMVVKLANKMIDQQLLMGTYWFSTYTVFFSIACLIYYFHFANYNNARNSSNSPSSFGVNYAGVLFDDDLNIDMIKKDIEVGKKVLDNLKNNSTASLRIYNILNALFEHLNRRTASSSTQFKNQNLSAATLSLEDYETENVQATFKNFHSINNFGKDEDIAEVKPNKTDVNDTAKLGYQDTEQLRSQNTQPPQPDVGATDGNAKLSSSDSISSEVVDYMPGVFDTIDAKIFDKILPPYMLQTNKKEADGTNLRRLSGFGGDSSGLQLFSPTNFDFLETGANDGLDYLDNLSAFGKD